MRHHFGDFLDREGGYWTMLPNRERYAYRIGDVPSGSQEITSVTIGKEDEHWARALSLPNLVELTLHEPTQKQLVACSKLGRVQRLRITHARPKSIDFIASMVGIEELVLEYVSGFDDLSPLRVLPRLRALHIENLRRVSDFGGLGGLESLKYLAIQGTLDWQQPIRDFEFLRGLPNLEVLRMWQFISKAPYPALLPALALAKLKKVHAPGCYLATEEYALLEEGLVGVDGASWGPWRLFSTNWLELAPDDIRSHLPEDVIRANHPDVLIRYDGKRQIRDPDDVWFEFTGRAAGRVKSDSKTAKARCEQFAAKYADMKARARTVISERSK